MTKDTNLAVQAKKKLDKKAQGEVRTHTDGTRYKLHPVASYVVREAQLKLVKPVVPIAPHPNAPDAFPERYIENPMDTEYQQAMQKYEADMELVGMDAMMLFGIELLSDIPENDKWLKNLKFLKLIDEIPDDIDIREFYYKKYILSNYQIIFEITGMSGISQEGVAQAIESFRGDEERGTD